MFGLDPFVIIRYYGRNPELRQKLIKPVIIILILLPVFISGGVLLIING